MENEIVESINVFTPTRPARIAFVERKDINDKLVNALRTPGKQIVVYGHSGSGKTTLLVNKLHQIYENHKTTRCMAGMTFDQIVLDAFDQLSPYFVSEKSKVSKKNISADVSQTYVAINSKINASTGLESSEKTSRALPMQLSPQNLARLIGASFGCWVLEDFHKVDITERQKLAQLMKVFMDMSDEYPDLKIVALGAVDTARLVVDYDSEMRNRVSEISVDLMSEKEISEIIDIGSSRLNVVFDEGLKRSIANYSNGLPAVCHQLCLNMCNVAGIERTHIDNVFRFDLKHFKKAVKSYVEECSDSIRSKFDVALRETRKTKLNNAEVVLRALASFKDRGASRVDLLRKIHDQHPSFRANSLKTVLDRLCCDKNGAVVRYQQMSNLYCFSDPFYRVFAIALFEGGDSHMSMSALRPQDVERISNLLLTELKKIVTQ